MTHHCEKINTILTELQTVDLSSTARLVAVLEACGITDTATVEALTVSKASTIREARRALKIQRQKSITAENPAPEIQRTAGNPSPSAGFPALPPKIQRQKSSADDTTRWISSGDEKPAYIATPATIESSSKILSPSEEKVESKKEEKVVGVFSQKAAKTGTAKKGKRLPDTFEMPSDWMDWTRTNCPGSTAETAAVEALKFANYWQAMAGAKACKIDWRKTWQNWCMTAFSRAPLRPAVAVKAPDFAEERRAKSQQWLREIGAIQ